VSAIWLIVGLFVGGGVTAMVMRERIRALRDGQQQMSDSFKAMSAEALDASVKQLSELAKTQLQTSNAQATGRADGQAAAAATRDPQP
jgi:flagellar motor component MotA